MRLSDERLDRLERHILNANSVDPEPRPASPDFRTFNDNYALALIAEVLALRKCEEALADLEANGTRVLDVNHHAGQSVWTAVQDLAASLIRARAALAAVRELEQP